MHALKRKKKRPIREKAECREKREGQGEGGNIKRKGTTASPTILKSRTFVNLNSSRRSPHSRGTYQRRYDENAFDFAVEPYASTQRTSGMNSMRFTEPGAFPATFCR